MRTTVAPKMHFCVDLPFTMPMYCRPPQAPRHTTRDRAQVTCSNCARKLARWQPQETKEREDTAHA